ncbi:VOC family protein [Kineococcus glutinatus]|uniref:VOC family protein n=1 Tax=Kineococcus glutinatus TaxID=1070872 RepID=A0ABP9I7H0_9ACTN
MPTTIPCLWFDGQAEQAAEHYVSIFPNSTILSTTRTPAGVPDGEEGAVMVVEFSLDGQRYVGLNGGPQFTFSEAVSFQVHCADQAEVDHYWGRLTEGGEEGPCGWLKDRFGLSWQVVPTVLLDLIGGDDPGRAQRASDAMMQMRKIVVDDIVRAADAVPAP